MVVPAGADCATPQGELWLMVRANAEAVAATNTATAPKILYRNFIWISLEWPACRAYYRPNSGAPPWHAMSGDSGGVGDE
jgi:hypothetical protein